MKDSAPAAEAAPAPSTADHDRCLCGASLWAPYLSLSPGTSVVLCERCGLARTRPYPTDPGRAGAVEGSRAESYRKDEALYRRFARPMVRRMHQLCPAPADHVDLGCNIGILVDEARRAGYRSAGFDLDREAVQLGLDLGHPVHLGSFQQCGPASADLVTASHTLEHILDLHEALEAVREVLRPGGFLLVSQPCHDSWTARVQGPAWYGWQQEQHHWHFTPKTLGAVLQQHGFQVTSVFREGLHHPFPPPSLLRHPRTFLRRLGLPLLARLAVLLGRGDAFSLAARKERP